MAYPDLLKKLDEMFSIGNLLIRRYPKLQHYKPGIDFLARLFFIGIFILLIKKIYGWNATINGVIDYPILGPSSPIEFLRQILLISTKHTLDFLGHPSFIRGWVVGIQGGGIKIETPCLGINVCFIFIALVAAFPSKLKWYYILLYIISGLFIIQFFNLLRMIAMVFVVKNQYHLPIEHHDLFNIIIYLIIFSLFYFYINFSSRETIER